MSVTGIKRECKTEVISLLEYLLSEAKNGKITELVVMVSDGSLFRVDFTSSEDVTRIIGGLEVIKQNQINRLYKN